MSRDELVRIDDTGLLHPVGRIASQRMRARKGAFRLMPAPSHVMFFRYVGEDGERGEDDRAVVRLAGEVTAPGALCDIMGLVAQAGWKGELVVVSGEDTRSLFFEAGNILAAQTNVVTERLGPPGTAERLAAACGGEVLEGLLARSEGDVRRGARRARTRLAAGGRLPLRIVGFGEFMVLRGGQPVPRASFERDRARMLLAALAAAGAPVPRDRTFEWLWHGDFLDDVAVVSPAIHLARSSAIVHQDERRACARHDWRQAGIIP